MVVDEADRDARFRGDAPHGEALVAVPLQALDRRIHQRLAPVARDLALEPRLSCRDAHCGRGALRLRLQPLRRRRALARFRESARMRLPKLLRHTSPSPSGPVV